MRRTLAILLLAVLLLPFTILPVEAVPVITDLKDEEGNTITGGVYSDGVKVLGHGVTAGAVVNLYWDSVKSWDGEKGFLGSSEGEPDGSFSISFSVPQSVNGPHYLWVKDEAGGTAGPEPFDVDAVIRLSALSGQPGDSVTIRGYGFGKQVNVVTRKFGTSDLTTNPSLPVTSSVGSWEATFIVPSKSDGNYTVTMTDASANSDSEVFKIGPAVGLDFVKGPVGKVVRATGRGFTPGGTVNSITLGGVGCGVLDSDDLHIDSGGGFRFDLVVPSVGSVDEHLLRVGDSGGRVASLYFNVTGLAKIEIEPMFGPPGSSISISGVNFAPSWDVIVSLGGSVKAFRANSAGSFSGTYTIPAISQGTYDITARQASFNVEAKAPIRVGTMVVILSPTSGPTGTKVALTGTGFTPGGSWNATIGSRVLFSSESVSGDTTLFGLFYVPTIDPGVYTVTVADEDEGIRVTRQFNVTDRTSLETDPTTAPVGYNVTLEGGRFAVSVGEIDVSFVVFNSTDDWDMDVRHGTGAVKTDEDGGFTAWWVVPEDLAQGAYTINATDDEGLFAQCSFSVGSSMVKIASRKDVYAFGNTVGFNIESSFREEGSYIVIKDPGGNLIWRTDDLDSWLKVGLTYVVPLYTQTAGGNPMVLESDAPQGVWTYKWYDSEDDELASGSFVVWESAPQEEPEGGNVTKAQYEELLDEIDELKLEVTRLESELGALIVSVQASSASTSDALEEVVNDVEDMKQDVSSAREDAEEAKTAAVEAKGAVDAVRSEAEKAISDSKNLSYMVYAAIGISLLAAGLAFVGPIQITRRVVT